MQLSTTFDSTKEQLSDMLATIRTGKTQLPDFQRGWVWDDEHIRSLLASISRSFPVGAVMMLQTGNPNVRLKPRAVEGLTLPAGVEPERLILDGQQRLTSLFQALCSGDPVATKDVRGKPIKRWYYVHIPTATFAADNFNLREDWDARLKRFRKHSVLHGVENTDLLQAIALLTTYSRREKAIAGGIKPEDAPGVRCKREDVLALSVCDYQHWAEPVTKAFERASKFLHALRFFAARDVPYRTQLVPLAASLALLGDDADNDGVKSKITRWFWCGVFGELYGGATESRFAKDVADIVAWIKKSGPEPSSVTEAVFVSSRLLTLRTRNSAAYKGVHALLMLDGGLDFRTGDSIDLQTYFDEKIDIHHVFPKKWCIAKKLDRRRYDSIVNKTPLAARTNRMIGGHAPSAYLPKVEKSAGISNARMDDILSSHVITPALLRADNFDGFFAAREKALLDRIEKAMGKPPRIEAPPIVDVLEDFEDETDDEEDAA